MWEPFLELGRVYVLPRQWIRQPFHFPIGLGLGIPMHFAPILSYLRMYYLSIRLFLLLPATSVFIRLHRIPPWVPPGYTRWVVGTYIVVIYVTVSPVAYRETAYY